MANSQKIVHLVRRFVFKEWGSTETVIWNSVLGLLKKGNACSIISTSALDKPGNEVKENCLIQRHDYFYPRLGLDKKKSNIFDKKGGNPYSYSLFQNLVNESCRIIHCHSMQRVASMARLAAKIKKVPYVITLHGGLFSVPQSEINDMALPLKGTFNYGKVIDLLTRPDRILRDANGIICIGYDEFLAVKKAFPLKPSIYLPNGVNIQHFRSEIPNTFKAKFDIPQGRKIILCVSRIDTQKNQLALVELLNDLNNHEHSHTYHLVLVGAVTSDEYLKKIESTVRHYDLQSQFTLVPGLAPLSDDLVNAYRSADTFILPSVHEPFGVVILEAWATGLPVIVSRIGGLAELVDDNRTGKHFNPYKAKSLFNAFTSLTLNPVQKEKLIKNSHLEVETKYSWNSYTKRLLNFYENVESCYNSRRLSSLQA